jgi:predicted CxxxxCH...CXXCH cytochrome family protein
MTTSVSAALGAFAAAALALGSAGCGVVRAGEPGVPLCADYLARIAPILERGCGECHGGPALGGYDVRSYDSALRPGATGASPVLAGEPSSPLLLAARGALAGHSASLPGSDLAQLEDWVVRCRASARPTRIHPAGFSSPVDAARSHAVTLRDAGYDFDPSANPKGTPFATCRECHGAELQGGKAGVACSDCHRAPEGPLACNTCHGDAQSAAPPRGLDGSRGTSSLGVGAHRSHVLEGQTHRSIDCAACHPQVTGLGDEGHVFRRGVFTLGAVDVRVAARDGGVADWNRAEGTCTNSACHAPGAGDARATHQVPRWTRVDSGEAACGTCHGVPPSSHADDRCELCHGSAYADGGVDAARHVNGVVDLRGGGARCDGCHAGPASATFVDLRGASAAAERPVGAHQVHLSASRWRGPVACRECHLVPSALDAKGHIDSPAAAEVFPAGASAGLAWAQGARPAWSPSSGTCSNVYCHAGGALLAVDATPGLERTPSWTENARAAECSTCHGLPPLDGHLAHRSATPATCHDCHGRAVDAQGQVILRVDPVTGAVSSEHLDGKLTGN